jgi:hypothetical protein
VGAEIMTGMGEEDDEGVIPLVEKPVFVAAGAQVFLMTNTVGPQFRPACCIRQARNRKPHHLPSCGMPV